MKTYTFDLRLVAATTVKARNAEEALSFVRAAFECADCNGGAWPDGDPILFEATLHERPDISIIDGEDVSIVTLRDWDELKQQEA